MRISVRFSGSITAAAIACGIGFLIAPGALAMPARDLATVLVSLGSGLSFSAMLEPSTPVDVMATVARLVLLGHT